MSKTPAIAISRRKDATANFLHKLDTLERLLADGNLDVFPDRVSITSFAAWADASLNVSSISRTIIYATDDTYRPLQQRMTTLLERLTQLRAKPTRKANLETSLRSRLEAAEARAQSYVDQYSSVMSELAVARREIEQLRQKLARQAKNNSKVVPLRSVAGDEQVPR